MTDHPPHVAEALAVARDLVAAGVPVFVAPPSTANSTGFALPKRWETATPTVDAVDRWREGWALCAVMGYTLDAVDVDPRHGGDISRDQLQAAITWPTVYATAATPSGGIHELIAATGAGSRDGFRPGLDLKSGRADGTGRGFVFIAPTVRASKTTGELTAYQWKSVDVSHLPDHDDSGQALAAVVAEAKTTTADNRSATADERGKHAGPIPDGQRHHALYSYAGSLRRRDLPYAEAETLYRARWADCAQPPEATYEWTFAEALGQLKDAYGRYQPQPVTVDQVDDDAVADLFLSWPAFWATQSNDDVWLVEPVVAEGESVALYSPAKTGKSLAVLEIAAALATGRPVLGNQARPPVDVLYVDHENTAEDLRDRLEDMGYGPDVDLSHLHYSLLQDWPPLDSAAGGSALLAAVDATAARLVILDTVSRVLAGPENDADTFRDLYRHTIRPLKRARVAVLRLDHTGKDAAKGQRGSSAKSADVDTVWLLVARSETKLTLKRTHSRSGRGEGVLFLVREEGPLRHVVEAGSRMREDAVAQVISALDDVDFPVDGGYRKASEVLREIGAPRRNDVIRTAIARRRARVNTR